MASANNDHGPDTQTTWVYLDDQARAYEKYSLEDLHEIGQVKIQTRFQGERNGEEIFNQYTNVHVHGVAPEDFEACPGNRWEENGTVGKRLQIGTVSISFYLDDDPGA